MDGAFKPNILLFSSHTIGKVYAVNLKGTNETAEENKRV